LIDNDIHAYKNYRHLFCSVLLLSVYYYYYYYYYYHYTTLRGVGKTSIYFRDQ